MKGGAEERYLVTWQLGRCYKALGKVEAAKRKFQECIDKIWWIPLAYVALGEIAFEAAMSCRDGSRTGLTGASSAWAEAEHYFKTAQELASAHQPPDSNAFYPQPFFTWLPWWKLAELYERVDRYDQALFSILKALECDDLPHEQSRQAQGAVVTWRAIVKEQMTIKDDEAERDEGVQSSHSEENSNVIASSLKESVIARPLQPAEAISKAAKRKPRRRQRLLFIDALGSFTGALARTLEEDYQVKVLKAFDPRWVWWSDIAWFEWCDDNLVEATRYQDYEQQIICRIHGYEAYYSQCTRMVDWRNVDDVIFVADHVRDTAVRDTPEIELSHVHTIPNGVDLSEWSFAKRKHGHNIAFVGYLNSKKNIPLLLHLMEEIPPDYRLHIAGEFQDAGLESHFCHFVSRNGLSDRIIVSPWVDDVDSWLEPMNYLISPSMVESFNYAVAEAMAKGIKPLIYDWKGAREIWGDEFVFRTAGDLVNMLDTHSPYESRKYRRNAARFSLQRQIKALRRVLRGRKVPMSESLPVVGSTYVSTRRGKSLQE